MRGSSEFKRTDRISETVRRKLTELVQREITDPRLSRFVTLSAVNVTRDLSHAKIYFTVLNDDPVLTAQILNTAAPFLRSQLARAMTLRTVPQLHFLYDKSIAYGNHLSRLIDEVNPDDQASS